MLLALLSGCATTEYPTLPQVHEDTYHDNNNQLADMPKQSEKPKGIYHKINKGQTLWRIAKVYGVSVDDIIQTNNIPNVSAVEVGQLIMIPNANEIKDVPVKLVDEKSQEFAWPVKGRVISYFNDRNADTVNRGIDIEASEGDLVKAVRSGTVVLADYVAGYGQMLCVDHGDGYTSVYTQNRAILSKLGQRVSKGDSIAEVGRSGRKSYVHFELRKGAKAVNPLYYLPS